MNEMVEGTSKGSREDRLESYLEQVSDILDIWRHTLSLIADAWYLLYRGDMVAIIIFYLHYCSASDLNSLWEAAKIW